jgi:hypothetical protein
MLRQNQHALSAADAPLRCLWIARYIPYPMDAGAKVYTAKLAESLAEAGAAVRLLGFGDVDPVPAGSRVEWLSVPSEKRSQLAALISPLPIAAAVDATGAYKSLLDAQLREEWDAIVLDGYGTGWALQRCLAYCAARRNRPVLVHVSHNHEEVLWRAMASQARSMLPKRLVLWQNYRKVRALERRIVRNVDLLTAITDEDAASLGASLPHKRRMTLTPGHEGWVANARTITARTPRRVIIVGSFRWVMKQENLARFVEIADPVFRRNNIELDVVGDVPEELLATLKSRCTATRFHGFVDDIGDFFARARIAVVPELIGGGFKLKFLDYIFARVPTATLSQAATGLPAQLQQEMLVCEDLPALVAAIVANIDRIDDLNRMQERAFTCGQLLFRWAERGQRLRQAILGLHHERQAATPLPPGPPVLPAVPTTSIRG